jgi:alpha-beta hydrolase superfamily lysophospholipase
MNEHVVTFGSHAALVGTLTLTSGTGDGTGIVLLNAGFIHRVGPHRLNVRLARALARRGHPALRFDISGLGDSQRSTASGTDDERATAELSSAVDLLAARTGSKRFVLIGLCSGTDPCLHVARADPRIAGIVLIDPYAFRTLGSRLNYRLQRLRARFRAGRVLSAIARQVRSALSRLVTSRRDDAPSGGFVYRLPPEKATFEGWLRAILARGARIMIVYSAGFPRWYNYAHQFRHAHGPLADANGIDVRFVKQANHTFTELALQERLLEAICSWVDGQNTVDSVIRRV